MSLPARVTLVEMGPRDGLQNEPTSIAPADKIALVNALAAAGLTRIEIGAFVNPRWVPQMAGSEAVFTGIERRPGVSYSALIPNLQGFERALGVGANEVAVFAAASEAFSQRNINCSIAESLQRFQSVADAAQTHDLPLRGYISCALGCPYSGEVDPQLCLELAQQLLQLGCYEISLGDTIGVGTPSSTARLLETLLAEIPASQLAVHMHYTYGMAIVNIHTALHYGIAVVDASVAGLGGCPYAQGASGNVATEDVIYLLDGLGITHGVDLAALVQAGNRICEVLARPNNSNVARALAGKQS